MVALKQSFVLGSFSANPTRGLGVSGEQPLFEATCAFLESNDGFCSTENALAATCVDDRLDGDGKRRRLPHLPGGGMTIALMNYLLDKPVDEVNFLHETCLAMSGLKAMLGDLRVPKRDLALLERVGGDALGYATDDATLGAVKIWARRPLRSFLQDAPRQEAFPEGHAPVLAVVNVTRVGYTVDQGLLSRRVPGARVLSFDMWAVREIANNVAGNPDECTRMTLFGYLLAARTLRTVGSKHLRVCTF